MITKCLNNKIQLVHICMLFALNSIAQTYTPPTQERVSELLDQIEECKTNINELEEDINFMEANAGLFTLARYNEAKALLNDSKKCVASARKELDKLRTDYPGWFNSPSATAATHDRRSTTPRELKELMDRVQRQIESALSRFDNLIEPEN